ncbi:DMT family transporter [Actinobacillus vicugnae]|uniref:DMT family transporter n=1 Tax=Actinobacillus vicugnae TaxID=2573093 RepID=UPI00245304C2|nr:SMR family transporter [Actinobacillus vicugnae]
MGSFILAGLLEIGWPLGLKLATHDNYRLLGTAMAIAFMAGSGFCLFLAQKTIPMGTAYAVWTGIGAAFGRRAIFRRC